MQIRNKAACLFILLQFLSLHGKSEPVDASAAAPSIVEDPIYIDGTRSASTSIKARRNKADLNASKYIYSLSGEYQILTDLNSNVSPQNYIQAFDVDLSLNFYKNFDIGINAGVKYLSIGDTIPRDSVEATDISIKTSYSNRFSPALNFKTGLVTSLPTSDAAKVNGYEAVESAFISLDSRIIKGFYNIVNTVSGSYIFNKYKFSPGTTISNPDYFTQYELVNILRINSFMSFDIGVGARVTHSLDDINTLHFENQEALNFKVKQWHFALSYSNGSYLDQSHIDLWYLDKYRQIVSFGIVYEI